MAELLKNRYNRQFIEQFCELIGQVYADFNSQSFVSAVFIDSWDDLELKGRMRQIALALHDYVPNDFEKSALILEEVVEMIHHQGIKGLSLEYMFLSDYIELYGIDDFQTSMKAMKKITTYASCEFAIRRFIIKFPEQTVSVMKTWALDDHEEVRRLASEGCRPRLPWAIALPKFKKNPTEVLSILEMLKNDPSEYVRRSVANNLNDISKDNPDQVIRLTKSWIGANENLDKLLKHGCRTLLKAGNLQVMQLFGFDSKNIQVKGFEILTPEVKIGSELHFQFQILNTGSEAKIVRLEYAIYYLRSNGSHNKKVFKISERACESLVDMKLFKRQKFNIISTRKMYVGVHFCSVIVNGVEGVKLPFELIG